MIGLGKACSGGGALMNYVYDLKRGYELDRNLLCGNTPKELIEEIKIIQSLNQRALNKTFSFVISPDPSDSKKLNRNDLVQMSREFLQEVGIDTNEQQFVSFVHSDKEHLHIHIIANRVLNNGKLISDHHIGKRCQWIAHRLAEKHQLKSAKTKQIENIKTLDVKKGIKLIHNKIMSIKPLNYQTYKRSMLQQGIEILEIKNSNDIVQGFKMVDIAKQIIYKASEIDRKNGIMELYKNKISTKIKI